MKDVDLHLDEYPKAYMYIQFTSASVTFHLFYVRASVAFKKTRLIPGILQWDTPVQDCSSSNRSRQTEESSLAVS